MKEHEGFDPDRYQFDKATKNITSEHRERIDDKTGEIVTEQVTTVTGPTTVIFKRRRPAHTRGTHWMQLLQSTVEQIRQLRRDGAWTLAHQELWDAICSELSHNRSGHFSLSMARVARESGVLRSRLLRAKNDLIEWRWIYAAPTFDGHKSQFIANPDYLWAGDGQQAAHARELIALMEDDASNVH